jgi:soluble lytic murein transglycosylase-like protein
MDAEDLLLLLGLGALIYYAYVSGAGTALQCALCTIQAATCGWQNVNEGPTWVPVINQTEAANSIPTNLLARIAYQESHFRSDIITGATASCTGALGIMQLEPAYFSSVTVPTPFTTSDTVDQITQAGTFLASLYAQFSDWGLATAAYNAGATAVQNYVTSGTALPASTVTYVSEILTDVPEPTSLTLNA